MMFFLFGLSVATLGVLFFDVGPRWFQYGLFTICFSAFVYAFIRQNPVKRVHRFLDRRLAFVAIVFVLVLANVLSRRYEHVWDFSVTQAYALRGQSVQWLSTLKEPVIIIIFLSRSNKTYPYATWLQDKMTQITPNITVEIKNIHEEIQLAQTYGASAIGETILVSGNQWVKVSGFKEAELMPGLVQLIAKKTDRICFLTGHGELAIDDEGDDGLSTLREKLETLGYHLSPISLLETTTEDVAKHCRLLVVVHPSRKFLPSETKRLAALLASGLPVFLALGPSIIPELETVLNDVGVVVSHSPVINTALKTHRSLTDLVIGQYNPHALNRNLSHQMHLPRSQAIRTQDSQELRWQSFVTTPTAGSYRFSNSPRNGPWDLPLALIVAAQNVAGQGQVVIVGSGHAFSNHNIGFGDNFPFMFNAVAWLLKERQEQWAVPRVEDEPRMVLSPTQVQLFHMATMFVIPGLILLACFGVWVRRRRVGPKS